jgi:hypothetical protein
MTDENKKPSPQGMLAALSPAAKSMGLDIGITGNIPDPVAIPPISLRQDPTSLAKAVIDQVRDENIFLRNDGVVVTLQPDGTTREMKPVRFVSWAGRRCYFFKKLTEQGMPIREGMGLEQAGVVLEDEVFRASLRPLARVLPVRFPAVRGDALVLLPVGYDAAGSTYTMGEVEFAEDWTLEQANAFLRGFVGEFPWGDDGRSKSVWLASVLSPFVQMLCPALPPMFCFLANAAGSGKTILAKMGPIVSYGIRAGGCLTWDKVGDKLTERLNSIAKMNKATMIIDNVKGHIDSEDLESWLTTPAWEFRVFHAQHNETFLKNTITYLTGNECTLSDDLIRRSLMCELFTEDDNDARFASRKSAEVSDTMLASPSIRASFLSAMWAVVRNWWEMKCPRAPTPLPSYHEWGCAVGGMVHAAGWGDPLVKASLTAGGDSPATEFLTLLEAAVAAHHGKSAFVLTLNEWAALARREGVYPNVLGSIADMHQHLVERRMLKQISLADMEARPGFTQEMMEEEQAAAYLDRKMSTKFANILHRKRSGKRMLKDGTLWQFGSRKSRHSSFEMTMVNDDDEHNEQPF